MNNTIGVCGFYKTGSSTVVELLREFNDVNLLTEYKREFIFPYCPDGLEDLEYHLNKFQKNHSSVAIKRFRKLLNYPITGHRKFNKKLRKSINIAVDLYLSKIVNYSMYKDVGFFDYYFRTRSNILFKTALLRMLKFLGTPVTSKIYRNKYLSTWVELSILPDEIHSASKEFILDVLILLGYNSFMVNVINQPFNSRSPVDCFKYFNNPKAILVDRDPRDHYVYIKHFLYPTGNSGSVPVHNIDEYIYYYKKSRMTLPEVKAHNDVLFLNYEELVYDYENTLQKIKEFCNISEHTNKNKYFDFNLASDSVQLYKKHPEYDYDIKRIEHELEEFLFPFNNYSKMNIN